MARRGVKKPPTIIASSPDSLRTWAARHVEWARSKNYSERTIEGRIRNINLFIAWAEARDVTRPVEVTRPILERYLRYLFHLRQKNGKPLSWPAQIGRVTPLKALFRWLTRENVLLSNPASDLDMPRHEHRLPKAVLTIEEVERVLGQPDVRTQLGLRDRAMIEVLYSTAMRRAELANLTVFDVDRDRGTIMIRRGKGKRDRVVPAGERALAWIERYLEEVRPSLVVPPDPGALFLTYLGEPFTLMVLSALVRGYVDAADLGKKGACHLFRHTAATLMLENGADIRYVQELLGHAKITTTQIYTRVSIRKLKQVHADTHPGARLNRPPATDDRAPSPVELADDD
jgi:integrase/recombinase XerD